MLDDTRPESDGPSPDLATPPQPGKKGTPKEQSSIGFPYHHLSEVLIIPQKLAGFGVPCTRDQLAGAMNLEPSSSTFLGKINSARTFGLIETANGRVKLSQLGHDIVSTDKATFRVASAKAFLTVPLYRKTYDEFRGRMLPTTLEGLQNAFRSYGVSSKQTEKARQVFQRSAEFAGFFPNGRDRLIEPIVGVQLASATLSGSGVVTHDTKVDNVPDDGVPIHPKGPKDPLKEPLIHGLLIRMPEAGAPWDHAARAKWLQLLAANLDAVYEAAGDQDEARFITVEVKSL